MTDDAGQIRCGICGRAYFPGQSIRIISTTRGMVLIHRECERALRPATEAEAVVKTRAEDSAATPEKVPEPDPSA